MNDLTVILEEQRTHLRAVAYRLLGSVHEADDAVQETWLRLERSDVSDVVHRRGWRDSRDRTARRRSGAARPALIGRVDRS